MKELKDRFPIFNKLNIHYLDSAATTQKPYEVIESINNYYINNNGNAGRGSHELAIKNRALIDSSRKIVADFVGVNDEKCIIFTKSTTESLNMIAFSYAMENLHKDDEIILAISNHHSNIVPWQEIARIKDLNLRYVYLDEYGNFDFNEFKYLVNSKTKIVSISTVVNSTGVINPYREIIEYAHKYGVKVVLDCAQSIVHFKHELEKWDVDFAAFSGHKIFSAQGIGILYAKKELLENMRPFIFGGDMVNYVNERNSEYKEIPYKFEGGTQNISAIVSLSEAISFIQEITYDKIEKIEQKLLTYALFSLSILDFVEIYHIDNNERVGIIAFNVKGVHSHDVAFVLDSYKLAIRSGQHCSAPLMDYMGINSCCRISFSIYNTEEEIDILVEALNKVKEIFIK